MKKRIGLITPYQGYNFGDAAIQDTMIGNLNSLSSAVECYGITLYPADTEHRHGIPSIPLTGLVVQNFSEPEMLFARGLLPSENGYVAKPAEATKDQQSSQPQRSWAALVEFMRDTKNIPVMGNIFRFLVFRLRDIKKISIELRELVHAYRFVRTLNLLVVSGGGQLDEAHGGGWGHPYALFRWALLARLTGTPFVIASTGSAMIETWLTRWFLKFALRSAVYRSYRDIGTRNQLSKWGFTQQDPIVRDLALSINPTPYLSVQGKDKPQFIVAISPIYYSDPHYTSYKTFVTSISELIYWLIEQGHRVLLFRTTSVERLVIKDIWDTLQECYGNEITDQIEEVHASCYQELLGQIAIADLVIGCRLHSVILSHVLGKPTLAISWDRKVTAHMEDLDQNEYIIDIHSVNFERLKATFNLLEKDSAIIRSTLKQKIESYQKDLDQQFAHLLHLADN